MADDKKILIDITIDTDALEKSRDKAILAVAGFDKKLAEMKTQRKKDLEELSKAVESGNQKEIDAINKRTIAAEAETKSIQQSRRDQLKVVTLSNDLITQSDGKTLQSKEQLRKARGLEQIQLDQLKGTLKENADGQIVLSEAGERSVEQLNKYNTGLITFGKSANDGRENVGNYTNSILEAVDKTGLFGTSLGTVKEAFNAVRSGAASASDGIKKFKEGVSQSVSIVTEWAQSGRVAGEVTDTSTAQVGKLGGALDGAGKSGVSAGNAIKGALASTGIGLLVIVLASVINYLRQVEPVVEKVEQIFAGLGATVTAIGQTFFELGKIIFNAGSFLVDFVLNPMEAISNISLDGIFDGFLGAAKNITTAGVAAANLVKQTQELEDAERLTRLEISKNNIVAEKNRALSEDRTRSAKERLGFLQLAQDAEKKNLEIELRNKEKALKLIQLELHEKQKLGTISDELADRAIAQVNEVSELRARLANKDISDAAEASKKKLQDQKAYLQGVIALLNEELRTAELQGFATIELKKEVLKKQRDAELKESELSYEQRLAIEKKYQNDLLELDIETAKKREDIRKQSNQIAIDGIRDGQTREIAAESLVLGEKLDAIQGNSQEEQSLRLALIQQSAEKVLEIERKYGLISVAEKKAIAESNRNLEISESDKTFKTIEDNLKISLSARQITQDEFDQQLLIAKKQNLDDQLQAELNYQNQRQIEDARAFASSQQRLDEQLVKGTISQQKYNEDLLALQIEFYKTQGLTEIETQASVNATLNELDALRVEAVVKSNEEIIASDQALAVAKEELIQLQRQAALSAIRGTLEIAQEFAKGNEMVGNLLKSVAIAEIIINLQSEISHNKKNAAADPINLIPGGEAIVQAKLIAKNISASIQAGVSIAKIAAQKFEAWRIFCNDMIKQYNPTFTNSPSGYISRPTAWMNLAGEKEGEWIASGRLLRDPRTAPVIQSLENFQRTGALTFATGGFTTPFVIPNSVGASANDIAMAVKLAVSELQITPIVSVQEIIDVNSNMQNVRATATL
jgi:hypothetical protein